jgi:hypothetical protein
MKKTLITKAALIIILSMTAFFAGCREKENGGNQGGGNATPAPSEGFVFMFRNAEIRMNDDIEPILAVIGAPRDIFESPSCVFEDGGMDKIFFYPGVEINTYPLGGKDYVLSVVFKDDGVSTVEGVYLGMDYNAMTSAMGKGYAKDNEQYTYVKGESNLIILFEDGGIISIKYGLVNLPTM